MPSIDAQIEALCEAHDRDMARLHLGCSPYDDDTDEVLPASSLIIPDRE